MIKNLPKELIKEIISYLCFCDNSKQNLYKIEYFKEYIDIKKITQYIVFKNRLNYNCIICSGIKNDTINTITRTFMKHFNKESNKNYSSYTIHGEKQDITIIKNIFDRYPYIYKMHICCSGKGIMYSMLHKQIKPR